MSSIASGLNASGALVGLSLNPANLTFFNPAVPPRKILADGAGVFQTDAKQVAINQVEAEGAGVHQVEADQVGVNQVDAEGAGIHQTDAKQGDS